MLWLELEGRKLAFPKGESFCMVCGEGHRDTYPASFPAMPKGTGRIRFDVPLCQAHIDHANRCRRIGLIGASTIVVIAIALIILAWTTEIGSEIGMTAIAIAYVLIAPIGAVLGMRFSHGIKGGLHCMVIRHKNGLHFQWIDPRRPPPPPAARLIEEQKAALKRKD